MNALIVGLRSAIRRRHRSTSASTVVSRAFSARDSSAIVCASTAIGLRGVIEFATGVGVPFSRSEGRRRAGEHLEQRFQFDQASTFCIVNGGLQPRFDGHGIKRTPKKFVSFVSIMTLVD